MSMNDSKEILEKKLLIAQLEYVEMQKSNSANNNSIDYKELLRKINSIKLPSGSAISSISFPSTHSISNDHEGLKEYIGALSFKKRNIEAKIEYERSKYR